MAHNALPLTPLSSFAEALEATRREDYIKALAEVLLNPYEHLSDDERERYEAAQRSVIEARARRREVVRVARERASVVCLLGHAVAARHRADDQFPDEDYVTRWLRIIARVLLMPVRGKPIVTAFGTRDWDGSYQRYLDSCACPECGAIDELTAISGALCSWCWADEQDDDCYSDYEDEELMA